jgi:hypothetical protein
MKETILELMIISSVAMLVLFLGLAIVLTAFWLFQKPDPKHKPIKITHFRYHPKSNIKC